VKSVNKFLVAKNLGTIIVVEREGWSWAGGKIFAPQWREGLGPKELRAVPISG
jgi:hypothetical protein